MEQGIAYDGKRYKGGCTCRSTRLKPFGRLTAGDTHRTELFGFPDDNAIGLAIEEAAKKLGQSVPSPARLVLRY